MEVAPIQGRSLVPLLEGSAEGSWSERGLGWEAYEMDAYRLGDWKILRLPEPYGNGDWQLYDLGSDPGETTDLADRHPELHVGWKPVRCPGLPCQHLVIVVGIGLVQAERRGAVLLAVAVSLGGAV